ncbi:apoptogenic protein 1, mitochondrial-like isoform X1 [Centruroides sculpturatus]|uniref:apoptogenic protein 1, mitochondrial-like isoform X1 n=2 Tax=Centruroides sculpturatus TaxID=218467 RepID=UPI000C6E52EE|nr:apoptogenic protein 1, mitochondrial-like isoform X1 [Centruroides sculpturatus]
MSRIYFVQNISRRVSCYNFECFSSGKRGLSSERKLNENLENEEIENPPRITGSNWISPPHPVSNLRLIHFFIPKNELTAVREYREKVEEVQIWNQQYWERHNSEYLKLKDEFTKDKLKEVRQIEKDRQVLTASEMAIFYRKFLNDNHKKHMRYNREWYKKNVGLLWWAFRANLSKWYHKLKL